MDKSEQASSVYDKIAEPYAKEFSKPSEHIEEFLDLLPKKAKIIDVGCGVGVDAGFMASKGFKVIGIDLSKEMLNIARQKYPQLDFRQQDIRKLDFPSNLFDGIFASCSLIHIPKNDVFALLENFHHLLKKEGVIYISLQGGKSEEVFVDELFKPDEKIFLNIISFDEIKDLLVKNGFSIVKKYEREPKSKNELNYTKLYVMAKK
ncbi:MAG: class I SAM-dependent methyltransferase [Nanoarchaeota archaeon]|nr:class I SAM-dependent methyltransferase [Nanoarchaeota archaeon]MBU1321829.1 class I SAM-dependent methyltransferase [Nanoarchaeota archaeon]MBU1597174.1 class I SAM-dependent methyltransferase [Nanoarchaeota archaeon]MBU2441653.1 class I SAM-dependent methyltransferase [Nanoarchaeota archaeon]